MASICSWCNREIKPGSEEETIKGQSHGICEICAKKVRKEGDQWKDNQEKKEREEAANKEKSPEIKLLPR